MKRNLTFLSAALCLICSFGAWAQDVSFSVNPHTGAVYGLTVENDPTEMDWILTADGSQYDFIGEKYGWGLGYFSVDGVKHEWMTPASGNALAYATGDVLVTADRSLVDGELLECYTFTNIGARPLQLEGIGIYTPFNDNYPNSAECVTRRCHAHIWDGGDCAFVFARRMGGFGPHVGLVLTEGRVDGYDIWERGANKHNSQLRGVIALCPPDMELAPGQSQSISWRVFSCADAQAFVDRAAELGCVIPQAERYVLNVGEQATINYGDKSLTVTGNQSGELNVDMALDNGKTAQARLLVVENIDSLIDRRARFILARQRMTDPADLRCGAFMVYDNEGDSIYPNNTPNCNPVDRDEGAERLGMGVFLAKHYLAGGKRDKDLESALTEYADFVRTRLQTDDYKTYSSVDRRGRNRAYNYAWVADFYFLMYEATGNARYALDGYHTLRSMYDQFGHGFYAIGIPVLRGARALEQAGLEAERQALMRDFEQSGEAYIANGLNYPSHEVNYEQAIVAPCVQFLCELYLLTGEQKYLNEVERQLPVVEAFNGIQPSYHLNGIAMRHWDGYWFGKREMFGDTLPHYWSTITASVFNLYAKCTGNDEYQRAAENIVRNNLCLFGEDGRAYCAYLYPRSVNGAPARFYDPYANDQDWALACWYQVTKGL